MSWLIVHLGGSSRARPTERCCERTALRSPTDDRQDDEPGPDREEPGRRPSAEMIGFAGQRLIELEG
jgi:hypothetical protein